LLVLIREENRDKKKRKEGKKEEEKVLRPSTLPCLSIGAHPKIRVPYDARALEEGKKRKKTGRLLGGGQILDLVGRRGGRKEEKRGEIRLRPIVLPQ